MLPARLSLIFICGAVYTLCFGAVIDHPAFHNRNKAIGNRLCPNFFRLFSPTRIQLREDPDQGNRDQDWYAKAQDKPENGQEQTYICFH
jgi:hypothetical protein